MFETIIIMTMVFAIVINVVMSIFAFRYKNKYSLFLGLSCCFNSLVVSFYLLSIMFESKLLTSIFSSFYFIFMDLMVLSLFLFIFSKQNCCFNGFADNLLVQ